MMSAAPIPPALPSDADSHRQSFSSQPPPPPPTHRHTSESDEDGFDEPASASAISIHRSDTESPPPPPPDTIIYSTRTTTKHTPNDSIASISSLSSIPPPPPPLPAAATAVTRDPPTPTRLPLGASPSSLGDDECGVPFSFSGSHSDNDDGDDDSDLDGLTPAIGSSEDATGMTTLSIRRKHTQHSNNAAGEKQHPKLSFTAPSDTSPLTESGSAAGGDNFALLPTSRQDGVSLSSLSSQIALHMELHNFAAHRKRSIILTGSAANSLIPPSHSASHTDSPAHAAAAAAPTARRSHNIRSMSMSLAAGASPFASSLATAIRPSPAFQALTAAPPKARKIKRTKVYGDEAILDLFGDGADAIASSSSLRSGSRLGAITAFGTGPTPILNLVAEEDDPIDISALAVRDGSTATTHTGSSGGQRHSTAELSRKSTSKSSISSIPPPPPPMMDSAGNTRPPSASVSMVDPPTAAAPAPSSGDLTSSFVAPSAYHISHSFPYRKIIHAPIHSLTLLSDATCRQTDDELAKKERLLTLLLHTLQSNREEFKQTHIQNLRTENDMLRQLIEAIQLDRRKSASGDVSAIPLSPQLTAEATRRSLRQVAQHAEFNTRLHTSSTHVALQLEDLRRRMQLHRNDADSMEAAGLLVTSPLSASPPSANASRTILAPPSDLSSSKARSHAPQTASSGTPASPIVHSSHDQPSHPHTVSDHAQATPQAQLQRFAITKINRIRKNTPRILEIDLTTKTMTICKKLSSSSSSKSTDVADEFANRDIVISPGDLVSVELNTKTPTQLELSFRLRETLSTNALASHGGMHHYTPSSSTILSPSSSSSPGGGSSESKSAAKSIKNWKVIFASNDERERFYRLLHVTLLTPDGATTSSTAASAHVSASGSNANNSVSRDGSIRLTSRTSHDAMHAAAGGPLSTTYPQPQPNGTILQATYTPRIPILTASILSSVRLLPLLPLASSLHTIWCLNKKQSGWKYGLKLSHGSVVDPTRKTHPLLIPFHSLPIARRDYNLKVVTATLATVLALGFQIKKTFSGDETLLDARAKEKQSSSNSGLNSIRGGAGIVMAPLGSSSTPIGYVCPALLTLIDFFAECSHDLWSEDKLSSGWRYGPLISIEQKTHPGIIPYATLTHEYQEKERNQAYKILSTLSEWGYALVQGEPTQTQNSQPSAGSLKRPPPGTINGGTHSYTSRTIHTNTFIPPAV